MGVHVVRKGDLCSTGESAPAQVRSWPPRMRPLLPLVELARTLSRLSSKRREVERQREGEMDKIREEGDYSKMERENKTEKRERERKKERE